MSGEYPVSAPRSQRLDDIPARSAARHPHRLAIVHRDVRLTFGDLDDRIDRVAAALVRAGVASGDRVMVFSHNCWQYPVVVFAAARIGAVAVPVNVMLRPSEISHLIDDCRPAALVADDALAGVADEALGHSCHEISIRAVISLGGGMLGGWLDFEEWLVPGVPDPVLVADDAVIRIMYTSGTESKPKGVLHSSRSLMWQYQSCMVSGGMDDADVEVHAMPLYHCAQLDNFLITDIALGATSIILDRPDPAAILTAIVEERANKLFCPPTVWIALLKQAGAVGDALASLRKGYYGASALPVEVLAELRRRAPLLRLWNFYGQTEMGSLATVLPPDQQDVRPGSAGRAALNVVTAVVDDADEPVPAGVVGEIVHRSPQVALGYLNLPEATSGVMSGGWFHSGDLGYLDDDGYLWVVDRKKDMIKTGGENVSSREVEEVIFAVPGVSEVAVVGVPHPKWVEAVAVVVVPVAAGAVDEQSVISHCRARLAGFKVPKSVYFVDDLPRNPSGKILKRELREQLLRRS